MTKKLPMFLMPCLHPLQTTAYSCSKQLTFIRTSDGNNQRKMSKKTIRSLIFPSIPAIVWTKTPSVRPIGFRTGSMRPENDSDANLERTQDSHKTGFRNRTE